MVMALHEGVLHQETSHGGGGGLLVGVQLSSSKNGRGYTTQELPLEEGYHPIGV
jgi:hypothetical protein